jgi:hypothetical protein
MADAAPVFGRPEDWDKMSDEQKKEWALGMLERVNAVNKS